jgi:O-acetyl-ADP-ribose deacetylase (regulator of RNase III)
MIHKAKGNLLAADVEALVNTVNSVGVMGKGIALQFKQAFPDNYAAYEAACKREEVQPGRMFVFHTNTFHNPHFIINFPTKRHWKGKSKIEDIEAGLKDLAASIGLTCGHSSKMHLMVYRTLKCSCSIRQARPSQRI